MKFNRTQFWDTFVYNLQCLVLGSRSKEDSMCSKLKVKRIKIFLVNSVDHLHGVQAQILDGQTAGRYVPAFIMVHHRFDVVLFEKASELTYL